MLQLAHLYRPLQVKHSQFNCVKQAFSNCATFSAAGHGRWRCRRGQEQGLESSLPELSSEIEPCGHWQDDDLENPYELLQVEDDAGEKEIKDGVHLLRMLSCCKGRGQRQDS